MEPPTPPVAPDRIALLDIVRGFALPGILLMNIEWFSRWTGELGVGLPADLAGPDFVAGWLVVVLVQGKFWLLFALLFGAGFTVMQSRTEAAGRPFVWPYLRRTAMLFALGIAHALLLWVGDILHTYALAALGLLAFRRIEPVGRGVAGLLMFSLLLLGTGSSAVAYLASPEMGNGPALVDPAIAMDSLQASAVYASGDYGAVTAQRIADFSHFMPTEWILVLIALSIFLVGSWLLGAGPLSRPQAHRRFHAGMAFVAFPVGLAISAWSASLATGIGPEPTDAEMLVQFLGWVSAPLMALGYIGALALLSLRAGTGDWLRHWLAPAGRMALTNYLMASVVCSTLFYGYGFGLFGKVPRSGQVVLVLAITVFQCLVSRWWLARFQYGPLEWLWRAFTWLQWPPLRRVPDLAPTTVP